MKIAAPLSGSPFAVKPNEQEKSSIAPNVQIRGQQVDDFVALNSSRSTSGASLAASKAKSSAGIAAQAASEIESVREEQLSLAKRANNINDEESRAVIQTEIAALESEVSRISTAAVDSGGNNVLEGLAIEVGEETQIVLADISLITEDPGVDVTTISGASSAVTALTTAVSQAQQAEGVSASSFSKAEDALAELTAVESENRLRDPNAIKNFEQAESVTRDVSERIVNDLGGGKNLDQSLVSSLLDPGRAATLLQE